MANVDRPNGFVPVGTLSGAPWTSRVRAIGVVDGTDIFIGDMLSLSSGLVTPSATDNADIIGVCVGVGRKDAYSTSVAGAFNPADLSTRYYDDSANTHTDWVAFVAMADDCVYEAQTATALTLAVGDTCDLSATTGSTTTGISAHELTTNNNADFTVVEIPDLVDNDHTLVNGRYYVMVTRAEQALHA